jgi:hypothetical protein
LPDVVTAFREALGADLLLAFPEAEIMYGSRTGKAVDHPKLAVFWAGSTEQTEVIVGEARYMVRYWPVSPKLVNDAPSGVRDPSELEAAAFALQDFFRSKQTSYRATGAWYSRLLRVTPDYDPEEWGVEAELLVVLNNPAVVTA